MVSGFPKVVKNKKGRPRKSIMVYEYGDNVPKTKTEELFPVLKRRIKKKKTNPLFKERKRFESQSAGISSYSRDTSDMNKTATGIQMKLSYQTEISTLKKMIIEIYMGVKEIKEHLGIPNKEIQI